MFHPPIDRFDGIIGGSPCQCFSRLVHIVRHNGYEVGENLIPEYVRVITEAQPAWWVHENVMEAPVPEIAGYVVDPSALDNRWLGEVQSRKHRFAFGTRDGRRLHYETAALERCDWDYRVCASDFRRTPVKMLAGKKDKRTRKGSLASRGRARKLEEALLLQGLPRDFFEDSPFTARAKGEMLGNAVPMFMGRALARAVKRALA
jgi:DNA (cytosine-5)-methyltransferase 1